MKNGTMERKNVQNNTTRRLSPASRKINNTKELNNQYNVEGIVGLEDGGQAKEKRKNGYLVIMKNMIFLPKLNWISQNTSKYCEWRKQNVNTMILTLNSTSEDRIRSRRKSNLMNSIMLTMSILFFFVQLRRLSYKARMKYMPRHLRPSASNPIIPLFIHSFQRKQKSFFPTFSTLKPIRKRKRKHPVYGAIKYKSLEHFEDARYIKEIIDDKSGHVFTSADFAHGNDDYLDSYYADDDHVRHPSCRRVAWHKLYNPSCNTFHEMNMMQINYIE